MYAPLSFAASGGSQTFHYYFKKIIADPSFEVRLISCAKFIDKERAENELSETPHKLVFWGDPSKRVFQKIKNIESKYNPWNANANLIANTDVDSILKTIHEYNNLGYTPDIIILEWTPIVLLAEKIKAIYPSAKLIASEHDVTFVGYERRQEYYSGIPKYIWKHKAKWEKKKEIEALSNCDVILPHNPDNIDLLVREGFNRDQIKWLCPYFHNMDNCHRKSNGLDILFFGAMARPENSLSAIWFIENVMPLLSDLEVRFVILGSNPTEELEKYQSKRIVITGFVKSIVPYFESAVCLVAPLVLGAGIKVKILEGLSSGCPVITNKIGIEGIHARDRVDYIFASEPTEYEKAIRKAVSGDLEKIGASGKRFIQREYDLEKSYNDYRTLLQG